MKKRGKILNEGGGEFFGRGSTDRIYQFGKNRNCRNPKLSEYNLSEFKISESHILGIQI